MPKILIIEDNINFGEYLCSILQAKGYETKLAALGNEGLLHLKSEKFHLVFLDLILPDMDGITILKKIRTVFKPKDLPIIVLSATTDEQKIIEVLKLGANDFINKQATETILLLKTDNLIELQQANSDVQQKILELNNINEKLNIQTENLNIANQLLSKNEAKYRLFTENLSDVIWVIRLDTNKFSYISPSVTELLGYSVEEINGSGFYNSTKKLINSTLEHTAIYNEIDKLINLNSKSTVQRFEYIQTHKNGNQIWLETEIKRLAGPDGNPNEILGISRGIEERKKIEKRLRESEEMFRAISKYANEAIILIDSFSKIKFWNKAAQVIFMYSPHEIIDKEFKFLFKPTTINKRIEKPFDYLKQIEFGANKGFSTELTCLRKNKEEFPAEISFSAIKIKDQKHIIGIVRDITIKKQYENALKQKEKELREILEYQPIPICFSKKTNILYMNHEFKNFFGYTIEETPDWDTWFLKAYPDAAYRTLVYKTFVSDVEYYAANLDSPKHRIYNITVKNGELKYVEVFFSSIGEIVIGSFIDVTPKIENEKRLKELNATKDKFISILSHDLQNPFNSIIGFSELLNKNLEKYDTAKIKKFVNIIYNTSLSTHALLKDLLVWGKTQQNKIPFNPQKIQLSELCKHCISIVDGNAIAKKIILVQEIDEDIYAYADDEMVKTILRNLLTNAIKFTPKHGTVKITVTSLNQLVSVAIIDTGIGMDNQTMATLFKIGETVSKPGTEDERGTGLGLLLCKEFIEKNNGKIYVESSLRIGSKFMFTLPAFSEKK